MLHLQLRCRNVCQNAKSIRALTLWSQNTHRPTTQPPNAIDRVGRSHLSLMPQPSSTSHDDRCDRCQISIHLLADDIINSVVSLAIIYPPRARVRPGIADDTFQHQERKEAPPLIIPSARSPFISPWARDPSPSRLRCTGDCGLRFFLKAFLKAIAVTDND